MNNKNTNTKDEILQRIVHYLMLYGSHSKSIGLLDGKMGIAIFFFHYGRYTKKKLYRDFAGELMDEIYNEIHNQCALDFKNGLCGIGWGFEYLIRNNFVKADPDEILEELDKKILERDVRRIFDHSLETGLKGIANYIISRLANRKQPHPFITKEYIVDLIHSLERNDLKGQENKLLITQLNSILNQQTTSVYNILSDIVENSQYSDTFFKTTKSLGITESGHAGIGLKMIWEHQL